MKKIVIIACAALLMGVAQASGQSATAYKLANPELTAANPYTVLKVDVVVEKESIKKGPYARFAQKYLGNIAPLNDKDIYTIRTARLSYTDPNTSDKLVRKDHQLKAGRLEDTDFPKVNIDRVNSAERSLEDMAREAANMIYTIRKRRLELVTGEAGENVFGDGLTAALKELDRLEREYTALFFGKESKTIESRTFDIVPQTDKTNYIVCRFSASAGLMPESDLSGTPVVLSLAPEKGVRQSAASKNSRGVDYYLVADFVQCTLTGPEGELAQARIPIYQFGETVAVSSSSK